MPTSRLPIQDTISSNMIPSSKKNWSILLLCILLFQCSPLAATNAETSLVDPIDDSKLTVKKSIPGDEVVPTDKVNFVWEIINSTAVRWHIDFSSMLSRYSKEMNPNYSTVFSVNVSYHLMFSELSKYHIAIFCKLQERVLMDQESKIHQEECRKEMFSFRVYNQTDDTFNDNFDYHCEPQHKIFAIDIRTGGSITVGNLLPYQSYEFKFDSYVTSANIPILVDTRTHYVCLRDGPPQAPPQTDIASYSLPHKNHLSNGDVLVDLFWRTLPRLLAGASDISYELYCETDQNVPTINRTLHHMIGGHFRISKPMNLSYMCKVRSKNAKDYAPSYSPIIIPDKDRFIELGDDFKFYVYAVSNEEYCLEWTPIKFDNGTQHYEILPRNTSKELPDIDDGLFTIYWCVAGRAEGCSNLSGIVRTKNSASYNLVLPPRSEIAPRMFGISYIHSKPAQSTGIIWSKCVTNFAHQFMSEQVRISKAAAIENNHTAISINWDFSGCDSQVATIESYEINYCKVNELTGCSIVWSSLKAEDPNVFQRFEASSDLCKTVSYVNRFRNDANITNLSSASRYIIRLRYMLINGTVKPWSEPESAITLVDPELVSGCWNMFRWNFAIISLVVCTTLAICCTKSKSWFNYCKLIKSKFNQTTEGICSFVSDVTANDSPHEVTMKYCANGGNDRLTGTQSELSLSFLFQDERSRLSSPDGITSFEDHSTQICYNHINQVFDYIPKNLIENTTEDTTPEIGSDSNQDVLKYENSFEQDEISINSHPLIWDTNSIDEFDFNNNQTDK